jgi:hypothetical protein
VAEWIADEGTLTPTYQGRIKCISNNGTVGCPVALGP